MSVEVNGPGDSAKSPVDERELGADTVSMTLLPWSWLVKINAVVKRRREAAEGESSGDVSVAGQTTSDGRVVYDVASVMESAEVQKHLKAIRENRDKLLAPRPVAAESDK